VCLLPVLVEAGEEKSGPLTDPIEILKKADAACKSIGSVQYDFVFEGLGDARAKLGKIEGSMTLSGYMYGGPEKSLIDVTATKPDSSESCHITGGSDGEVHYLINHKAKKAHTDIDSKVVGKYKHTLHAGVMIEFLVDEPYRDEIKGKAQKLTGSKVINGEDCYEVFVVYATKKKQVATWYFSKKDFLPRGRVDEWDVGEGRTFSQQKMIANLVVEPKLDEDAFKPKLPEGYTTTDEFAAL
jgi:hypothetical protein